MICDVLEEAKDYYDFENAIHKAEDYIRLSDSIFYEIEYMDKILSANQVPSDSKILNKFIFLHYSLIASHFTNDI